MSNDTLETILFEANELTVVQAGSVFRITGEETRNHAELLRSAGAKWDRKLGAWEYTGDELPGAIADLFVKADQMVHGNNMVAVHLKLSTGPVWQVSGETRPHTSALRKTGGAWDGKLQAWRFEGESLPFIVLAVLLNSADEVIENESLEARRLGDMWAISGETRPHMKALRKVGATWDGTVKVWMVEGATLPDEIAALFDEGEAVETA